MGPEVIYLLDTNIVSQRMVERPHAAAMLFLNTISQDDTFLSVITLMEIRAGIERLDAKSSKRVKLDRWLTHRIPEHFAGRVLPVTAEIAGTAGRLLAAEKSSARTPHIPDLLLAATAQVYGMSVVTLNRRHFESLGISLVDL